MVYSIVLLVPYAAAVVIGLLTRNKARNITNMSVMSTVVRILIIAIIVDHSDQ